MNISNITEADINKDEIEKKIRELYHSSAKQNHGQHNCGILFTGDYVIKCVAIVQSIEQLSEQEDLDFAKKINSELEGLFPKYYTWPDSDESIYHYIPISETNKAKCFIMEKLEGVLTDYILRTAYIRHYDNDDEYQYMYERFPKTMQRTAKKDDKSNSMVINISKYVIELVSELQHAVIKLHHDLLKKGWNYRDLKFDNIGYKIINNEIKLYFIDAESGLSKYDENKTYDTYNSWKNFFLSNHWVSTPLYNYSLFGQYTLRNIGINIDNLAIVFNEKNDIIEYLKTIYCVVEESSENEWGDVFLWIKFRHKNNNDFFVIQKVISYFRLVRFDDYSRHMSNPSYNKYFAPVDKLFESVDELFKEIHHLFRKL